MVDAYRSARQFGISVILLTMLFRLFETGLPQKLLPPNSIREDRETELLVRSFSFGQPRLLPFIAESPPPTSVPREPEKREFSEEDAAVIALSNASDKEPALEALLAAPLEWSLGGMEPSVLILHTHTTESYEPGEEHYPETAPYRTLEEEHNMLSIGSRVAEILEAAGISVVHDRKLHDYPSYSGAYNHARKAIRAMGQEHPGIRIVLDLHRDASEGTGGQLRTAAEIDGQPGAQLMFVVGCGNAGLKHPRWEENLSLALKLQVLLEKRSPGICRPISLRNQRYNQDLSPGALLVEVGAAGNTREEALLAAQALAEAIICLKNGTK